MRPASLTPSRRTGEIGIRIALGALATDVVWLVMRAVAVAGLGLMAGMAVALAITPLLGSQFFAIHPNDQAPIAIATAGIAAIAAVSGYIPARRATRVDPVTAIRWE